MFFGDRIDPFFLEDWRAVSKRSFEFEPHSLWPVISSVGVHQNFTPRIPHLALKGHARCFSRQTLSVSCWLHLGRIVTPHWQFCLFFRTRLVPRRDADPLSVGITPNLKPLSEGDSYKHWCSDLGSFGPLGCRFIWKFCWSENSKGRRIDRKAILQVSGDDSD
jgi:hypothetical protein